MKELPTQEQVNKAKDKTLWDLGNKTLYDLCENNINHNKDEEIVAKVWLIGRAYAAAVERRKNKTEINDNFYLEKIAPAFRNSKLDEYLNRLKDYKGITADNLPLILEAHDYVMKFLREITDQDKRSFSSKYLHFHLPNLFFIYDSRAETALRQFISSVPKELNPLPKAEKVDQSYAKFVYKCYDLKTRIEAQYKTSVTPRQLDNILIEVSNTAKGSN